MVTTTTKDTISKIVMSESTKEAPKTIPDLVPAKAETKAAEVPVPVSTLAAIGSGTLIPVNTENIAKTVENGVWVVFFHTDWCAGCKVEAPIIDDLVKDKTKNVCVVDVEKSPQLLLEFNVKKIPTVMVLVNGLEVSRNSEGSFCPKELLLKMIESAETKAGTVLPPPKR